MVTRFDEIEVARIKEVSSGCIASITLQPILRERDGDEREQKRFKYIKEKGEMSREGEYDAKGGSVEAVLE